MAGVPYNVEWPARSERAIYANRFDLTRQDDGIQLQFAYFSDGTPREPLRVMLTISGVSVFARLRPVFRDRVGAFGIDRGVSWALPTAARESPCFAANGIRMAVDEAGGEMRFGWRSPFDIISAIEPGGMAVPIQSVVEVRMVAHMLAAVFSALSDIVDTIDPNDYPYVHPWPR